MKLPGKQIDIYGEVEQDKDIQKIKAPTYIPKNKKPHILELVDNSKTSKMIKKIEASGVTDDEKTFLIQAAQRHNKFHYGNIADYYAHSNPEMQELMEESALVIIDFNKAIEYGFIEFTNSLIDLLD